MMVVIWKGKENDGRFCVWDPAKARREEAKEKRAASPKGGG